MRGGEWMGCLCGDPHVSGCYEEDGVVLSALTSLLRHHPAWPWVPRGPSDWECRNFPLAGEGAHPAQGGCADPGHWEFQLYGCLGHSGDVPRFWIERKMSHFIVLLRIRFRVLQAPQWESFPNVSTAWAQSSRATEPAPGV